MMNKLAPVIVAMAALGAAQDPGVVKQLYERLEDKATVNDQCHPGGGFNLTSGETIPPCVAEQFFSSFCERVSGVSGGQGTPNQWDIYRDCLVGEGSTYRLDQQACLGCKLAHHHLSQERHDWFAETQEKAIKALTSAEHPEKTAWDYFQANADWKLHDSKPAGDSKPARNLTVDEYYKSKPAQQRVGQFTINNQTYPGPDFNKRISEVLQKTPSKTVDVPRMIAVVIILGGANPDPSAAAAVPTTLLPVPQSAKPFNNGTATAAGSSSATAATAAAAAATTTGSGSGAVTGFAETEVMLSVMHAFQLDLSGLINYACIIGRPQRIDAAPKPVSEERASSLFALPADCQQCENKVSAEAPALVTQKVEQADEACVQALASVKGMDLSVQASTFISMTIDVQVPTVQQLTGGDSPATVDQTGRSSGPSAPGPSVKNSPGPAAKNPSAPAAKDAPGSSKATCTTGACAQDKGVSGGNAVPADSKVPATGEDDEDIYC